MKFRAVVVIAISLALTGCGSSTKRQDSSSAPPSSPTSPAFPARDLKPQLLTISDLPTGWSVDNSASSGGAAPACLKALKAAFHTADHANANFIMGTDFPQFSESIGYYGATATAISRFNSGAALLNNCGAFSITYSGQTVAGSIGALSFPKVGQQSNAWQISFSIQGYTFTLDAVLAQKGPELCMLTYGDLGTPDLDEASSLGRKALAKMPAS